MLRSPSAADRFVAALALELRTRALLEARRDGRPGADQAYAAAAVELLPQLAERADLAALEHEPLAELMRLRAGQILEATT